jgi:hypothetical protein
MATELTDLYTLEVGAEYDELSSLDFADVIWQAFDRDRFESISIEATRTEDNIKMRVLDIKPKHKKRSKEF